MSSVLPLMKIDSISVENVRSFKEKETIKYNDDFNIIIGPNGGGKSNLLDIGSVILNNFFLETHEVVQISNREEIQADPNQQQVGDALEKNLDRPNDDSIIKTRLKVSKEDIQNIESIYNHKSDFRDVCSDYSLDYNVEQKLDWIDEWVSSGSIDGISEGDIFEYTIENEKRIDEKAINSQTSSPLRYVQYLNSLDLFILLSDDIESIDLQPVYFYFPPYRGGGDEDTVVNITPNNYYKQLHDYVNSTSREQASAIDLAQFKLAALKRSYEVGKGDEASFDEEKEVKLLEKNFRKIGFDWSLEVEDEIANTYTTSIRRGGYEYKISQMSSGEREITNFLLGILATDIRNGVIIIDEPELHLHPRWQSLLLTVLNELENLTDNQFIFTTHSPSFITRKSIKNVIRIYKDDLNTSRTNQVNVSNLSSNISDLIHIIHSSNNEKMFFADSVILVEGSSDRIIFESLIEHFEDRYDTQSIIEILNVDGKGNFAKYSNMLSNLGVEHTIIADLDYAANIDNNSIEDIIDYQKDGVKTSLDSSEQGRLENFISKKVGENIYLLPKGELEDHLPYNNKKVEKALELTKPANFIRWMSVPEEETLILKDIADNIVSSISTHR